MNELQTLSGPRFTEEMLAEFARSLDVSPATAHGYVRQVRNFIAWLDEEEIERPKPETVIRWKRSLLERGLSPYSVNAMLAAVRNFFRWLELRGEYLDISRSVKGVKIEPGFRRDFLTVEQAREVLLACRDKREAAMLHLLLVTGLRSIEVVRASRGDLRNKEGRLVLMVHGKGHLGADDYVKVPKPVADTLFAYLETRGPLRDSDPLFAGAGNRNRSGRLTTRTVRRLVMDVIHRAGIRSPKITTHSCRHSAITFVLKAGNTIEQAQMMARHKSALTTQLYAHHDARMEDDSEEKTAAYILGGVA